MRAVIGSLFWLLTVSMFAVIAVVASMTTVGSVSPDPTAWVIGALLLAVFADVGLLALRKSLTKGATAPFTYYNRASPAMSCLSSIAALGAVGGLGLFIAYIGLHGGGLTWQTAVLLLTWGSYVVGRPFAILALRPLAADVAYRLGHRMPTYTIEADAVSIDLNLVDILSPGRRHAVSVGFDELTDVVAFPSLREAKAYLQAGIATDPGTRAHPTAQWYRYLAGHSSRPRFIDHLDGSGYNVLLYGPRIVYGLTFAEQDTRDLVAAFQAYRQAHSPAGALS